jgi:hypothetical protein
LRALTVTWLQAIAAARRRNVAVGHFFRGLAIGFDPDRFQDPARICVTSRSSGFVRLGLRAVRKTP